MAVAESNHESGNTYTLNSVREALIRQEDTIVFALIERVKFPINSRTYDDNYTSIPGFCGSLVEFIVRNTEANQAKVTTIVLTSLLVVFVKYCHRRSTRFSSEVIKFQTLSL